jgi:hypothetical protein
MVNLHYWGDRVLGILAMPLLPIHIEKQAKDLLGRLDRLERPGRGAGAGSDAASLLPAH